jgi:Raf kinase inhibitor-like YbhB/YbcL family protein
MKLTAVGLTLYFALLVAVESPAQSEKEGEMPMATKMAAMKLTSPAFAAGEKVPKAHTCDGANSSPALVWEGVPPGSQSLALIVDDPDAPVGTWVHWVAYDLPPDLPGLPEGLPNTGKLDIGGTQGNNDFRKPGYGGPCPPRGTHRYFFKLYALDIPLNWEPGKTKKDLVQAMEGHVLAEGELIGLYSRER